jgi:hypothetical protein
METCDPNSGKTHGGFRPLAGKCIQYVYSRRFLLKFDIIQIHILEEERVNHICGINLVVQGH